jgi:hypothetical protein
VVQIPGRTDTTMTNLNGIGVSTHGPVLDDYLTSIQRLNSELRYEML